MTQSLFISRRRLLMTFVNSLFSFFLLPKRVFADTNSGTFLALKTDDDWKNSLSPEAYKVLRKEGVLFTLSILAICLRIKEH